MTSRRLSNLRARKGAFETLEERQLLSVSAPSELADTQAGEVAQYAVLDPSGELFTDATPAAPEGVAVEAVDFDSLRFSWRDAENANRYRIERSTDDGATWELFRDSIFSTFTFAPTNVPSALYRVQAVNVVGETTPSAPVLGSLLSLLPPEDVSATLVDAQAFLVQWSAPEGQEDLRVVIERSVDDGETWTTLSDVYLGTSYLDTNIPIGAAVRYRLSSLSYAGRLSESTVTTPFQLPRVAPETPQDLAATALNDSDVSLAWRPTPGAASYCVERSLDDGETWTLVEANVESASYVDDSLADLGASSRLYRVIAQNQFGTSEPTDPVAPVPPQIRLLWVAESASNCATLQWLTNGRGFRSFVERSSDGEDWVALGTTERNVTSWRDATVSPSTRYAYRVSTVSSFGLSAPLSVELEVPEESEPPEPPTGLEIGDLSPTSATLRWNAVESADAYLIQRSLDGETWQNLARVPSGTQHVDEYLEPGATYAYRVAVEIDSERSEYSEPVETTLPLFAPAPLSAPNAYAISQTEVFLSWTCPESGATYILERSLDGIAWTTLVSAVDAYCYGDSNLVSNTEYRYRLTMRGATGTSSPSRETTVKTCSNLTAPSAPTVGVVDASSISLSWNLSPDAVSYELQRASEFENWRIVATLTPAVGDTSVEYSDYNLESDTRYYYRVRARNSNDEISVFSSEVQALTNATAPETPSGLEVVTFSSTAILASWSINAADSWRVERSTDGETWTVVDAENVDGYYIDDELTPTTGYFYRVSATNRAGTSTPTVAVYAETFPADDAYEPNDDFRDAYASASNLGLLTGATTLSNLTFVDDDDYYRFEINGQGGASHYASLSYATATSPLTLKLYDANCVAVATATNGRIEFEDLDAGVYYLRVCAVDPDETTLCASYSLTLDVPYVPLVKTAPTAVVATPVSTSEIEIQWTKALGATSHAIQTSEDGTTWRTLATSYDLEEWSDVGLASNSTQSYRVVARYDGDENDYVSSVATATTWIEDDDLLANDTRADVDAQVYAYANGGILGELTESASYDGLALPIGDEDWFAFDLPSRRVDASIVATFDEQDSPIRLQLYSSSDQLLRSSTIVDDVATLSLNTLAPGRYYLRVYADFGCGNSEYSLNFDPGTPTLTAAQGVAVAANENGKPTLTWNAVEGAQYYSVERATTSNAPADEWATVGNGIDALTFTDEQVAAYTRYYYRVRAWREGVSSNPSSKVNLRTPYVVPQTQTDGTARQYENCVVLTWTQAPEARSYTIQRLKPNGSWATIGTFVESTSYVDENFYTDSANTYRIRANGRGGVGNAAWSPRFTATVCSETLGIDSSANVALATTTANFVQGTTPTGAVALNVEGATAVATRTPANGTLSLNASTGSWSYSPTTYNAVEGVAPGTLDLFAVDVLDDEGRKLDGTCVVVESYDEPAPLAPVSQTTAVADSFRLINTTTLGGAVPFELDLLANDRTPSGAAATIASAVLGNSSAGTLTVANDGLSVSYVPASGFVGTVSVSYQIQDGSGASSSSTATIEVAAPPSGMTEQTLTTGESLFSSAEVAALFSGSLSFSWTRSLSAVVDGVAHTATISAQAIERNGATRLSLSHDWTYQYTLNGADYSGSFSSEYATSSSAARESVKRELHSYELIHGGSGGVAVNYVETNDFVSTEQVVAGFYSRGVYQKKTATNQASSTSVTPITRYGQSVPAVSHSFTSSFESSFAFLSETGQVGATTTSGFASTLGREDTALTVEGTSARPALSRTATGELLDVREGTKTVSSNSRDDSHTNYTATSSWSSSGWGAWSGSGSVVSSGSETSSYLNSGTLTQSSTPFATETRSATGTYSDSTSNTRSWNETLTLAPTSTGWSISGGTGTENQTSTSSSQSSWSGVYSRGDLAGVCSGSTSDTETASSTLNRSIANGEWTATSGSGTQSGQIERLTIDNSGGYGTTNVQPLGESGVPSTTNGEEILRLAPGESLEFDTTSTEFRRNYFQTTYSGTSSIQNGDWVVVGTGQLRSELRSISETVGRNGTYAGARGESGSTAQLYRLFDISETTVEQTTYDDANDDWTPVSAVSDFSQSTADRLQFSGVGSSPSASVTAFFDGDATVQGAGIEYRKGLNRSSEASETSHLVYAYASGDWTLGTTSTTSSTGSNSSISWDKQNGAFGDTQGSGDSMTIVESASTDSSDAYSISSVWNGTDWVATGASVLRSNADSHSYFNSHKTLTSQEAQNGAVWTTTTQRAETREEDSQSGAHYYQTLSAGAWKPAPSATIQTTVSLPTPNSYGEATFRSSPTVDGRYELSESESILNSTASGTLIPGVYGGLNLVGGTTSGSSNETESDSGQITSTLVAEVVEGTPTGDWVWSSSGTGEISASSSSLTTAEWSATLSEGEGLEETSQTESESTSSTVNTIYDSTNGWRVLNGSRIMRDHEATTVDTQLRSVCPSTPTLYGRFINWEAYFGKTSSDVFDMCVVEKAVPGVALANLEWVVDSPQTIPDANQATASETSADYEEYKSVEYNRSDATPTQNYGDDGLTYVVTSQTFSQSLRKETGADGYLKTWSYDGNDWNLVSEVGILRNKIKSTYSASSAGEYSQGVASGVFSITNGSDVESTETFNMATKTGIRLETSLANSSYEYSDSGVLTSQNPTSTESRDTSSAESISTTITKSSSVSWNDRDFKSITENDWFLDNIERTDVERLTYSLSQSLTESIDNVSDFISDSSAFQTASMSKRTTRELSEEKTLDSYVAYDYDANLEKYVLSDDACGTRSWRRDDEQTAEYVATGTRVFSELDVSTPGTVEQSWGTSQRDVVSLYGEFDSSGLWTYTNRSSSVPPVELSSSFAKCADLDDLVVGYHSTSTFNKLNSTVYETSDERETDYYSTTKDANESGWLYRVKRNSTGSPCIVRTDDFYKQVSDVDFAYDRRYRSSGVSSSSTWSTTTWDFKDLHTSRETRWEKDSFGTFVPVIEEDDDLKIGTAVVLHSYLYETANPYSHSYESYGGSASGERVNSTYNYSTIVADVYYDPSTYTTSWKGDIADLRETTLNLVGSGSYSSTYSDTTTNSSLEESQKTYCYELAYGTFDTRASQSNLTSIYSLRFETLNSQFEYNRSSELNSSMIHAEDVKKCIEVCSSEKKTEAYRWQEGENAVENVYSSWLASGNGNQYSSSSEAYDYEQRSSREYENYGYNFFGEWNLLPSGDFVYSPIALIGGVEGGQEWTYVNEDKGVESSGNYPNEYPSSTPFTSFYQGVRSEINTVATQINAYDVQMFGAYENMYGVHYNYPTLSIPNGQTFSNPGWRVEFSFLATPTPEASELSEGVDHNFILQTYVPRVSDEQLADFLVEEEVEAEINYWNLLSLNPITRIKTIVQIVDRYSQPVLLGIGDISEKIYEFTLKPSVDRVVTVYNNMKTDPNVSGLMLTYVVVGSFIADNVGVASLSNAFDGHDYVDNRELSTGERIFEGVSGAFDLVSTAVGGLNAIKSGIRATGQCDKLGKYFTDCCFTVEVQVVYCATIAVDAEENASDEPIISVENETVSEEPSDVANVETSVQETDVESDSLSLNGEIALETGQASEGAPLAEPLIDDLEETTNEDVHWIAYSLLGATATAAIIAPTPKRKRGSLSCDSSPCENDSEGKEGNFDEEGSAPCVTPLVKSTRVKSTTLLRRAFGGWKSTITRLFVFTLCISAIIALAVNSRHESRDTLPTELSVASSALPIETDNVVSVEETEEVVEVSTVETSESDEIVFAETPIDLEIEPPTIELIEEPTPDAEALATETVFEEPPTVAESAPEESENVPLCSSEARVELLTGSISEIQIGYRVPGSNPEGNDGSDEAAFASEDLYIFTFRVQKADGTFCKAKLLRSANWLLEQPLRCVSAFDGHEFNEIDATISDQSPYYFDWNFQFEVWLDLSKFGCVGWSKIVDVDNTFKYVPGEGNLVTGTFEHIAQETINLQIEGQEKPIGCTPTHPIWSEDREEFVPAGELFEGERVRVLNGDTKRVVQKLPRPGPEVVYNLEVFGEHVYHVTSDGVLVHNHCPERYWVYYAERDDGSISYIGRTNDFWRRKKEHEKIRDIQEIKGLTNLTFEESKAIEDMFIRALGLEKKGGQLNNKINGISLKNRKPDEAKKFREEMRNKLNNILEADKNDPENERLPSKIRDLFDLAIEYDKNNP